MTPSGTTDRFDISRPAASLAGNPALWVLLSGTFITVLDFFIVAVAIPSIQNDLHADATQMQWVVAAYGLAFASMLITGGRLGDLVGRRRLYGIGLSVFVMASIGCGLAPEPGLLIGARALQGLGSAMISPQVLGMLTTLFVDKARARAFAIYGLVLGLAATFGQLIGGGLIAWDPVGLGWRACFLINPLLAAPALLMLTRVVPADVRHLRPRIDLTGNLLLVTALIGLMLPMIEGQRLGWPGWLRASFAVAAVAFAAFVRQQRRLDAAGGQPLVPPGLFARPRFVIALAAALVFYMTNASFYFVLALYSQHGRGLDALGSGLLFSALAAGFFIASRMTTAALARYGIRVVEAGAWLLAAGHLAQWLLVREATVLVPLRWLAPVLVLEGAGIGLIMAPLTASALTGIAARDAGVAAGVFSTFQWLGNSLGVALVGMALFSTLGGGTGANHAGAIAWQAGLARALVVLLTLTVVFALLVRVLRAIDTRSSAI